MLGVGLVDGVKSINWKLMVGAPVWWRTHREVYVSRIMIIILLINMIVISNIMISIIIIIVVIIIIIINWKLMAGAPASSTTCTIR